MRATGADLESVTMSMTFPSSGITRMPVIFGSVGVFTYVIDFGTFGPTLGGLGTVNFQCWYRDPLAGGAAFNLSDGLEIAFVP